MGIKALLSIAASSKTPRAKLIRRTLIAAITLGLSYVGISGQLAEDLSETGAEVIIQTLNSDTAG
jgi:hypothetical protein